MLSKGQEFNDACKAAYPPANKWAKSYFGVMYSLYERSCLAGGDPNLLLILDGAKCYVKGREPEGEYTCPVANLVPTKSPSKVVIDETPLEVEDEDEYVARKYIQLKTSAIKRNKEFNLTIAEVRRLCRRKKCYYTGFSMATYAGENPMQRTIDRVDPDKGYVIGNVVSCCHLANQFKSKIEHEFSDFLPRKRVLSIVSKMFKD